MAQKLILPVNRAIVTAGFKNANYRNQFGFSHYGMDLVEVNGTKTIWGCGSGTVVAAGTDNVLGKVVVIKYLDCVMKDGTTRGVVQRIYHLNSINVSAGQNITKDTKIGDYGNTGQFSTGAHLHIEFDTDLNYPLYTPTIGSNSNILKTGTDSMLHPANVMFVKTSSPDYQTISGSSGSNCWISSDLSFGNYDGAGSLGGAGTGGTGTTYYPTPNYTGSSLVEGLAVINVDTSFSNREKIALANGISDYQGTAVENSSLLALLKNGKLKKAGTSGGTAGSGNGDTNTNYYAIPNYNGSSLVEALNAISVDSSFNNREQIAMINGISNYQGTASQNGEMLSLLMTGHLKKSGSSGGSSGGGTTATSYYPNPNYSGGSFVEALNLINVDSSFAHREQIAALNNVPNYEGTASQNTTLLNLLKNGQLKKSGSSGGSSGSGPSDTGTSYYPIPSYSGSSLVEALNTINVVSNFDHREQIANLNGISDYQGTAVQNNTLFALLMTGKLKKSGTPVTSGGSGTPGSGDTSGPATSMNLSIRQNLVSSSKHSIKCPYPMTPTYITVHNTAMDASAANEISYMINNNAEISYHYAVDNLEAVQGLPLNRNGWHAGDGANGTGNRHSIGVEICYSASGGTRFNQAENNAAQLIAKLMKQFNIPLANVRTHQHWSGKYCPARTLDNGWQRFLDIIFAQYQSISSFNPTPLTQIIYEKYQLISTKLKINQISQITPSVVITNEQTIFDDLNMKITAKIENFIDKDKEGIGVSFNQIGNKLSPQLFGDKLEALQTLIQEQEISLSQFELSLYADEDAKFKMEFAVTPEGFRKDLIWEYTISPGGNLPPYNFTITIGFTTRFKPNNNLSAATYNLGVQDTMQRFSFNLDTAKIVVYFTLGIIAIVCLGITLLSGGSSAPVTGPAMLAILAFFGLSS